MVPVRVVLAVQDEFYIEPFLHYVSCSEFNEKLKVTAFSKVEAFLERMNSSDERPDAVVAEPLFMQAWDRAGDKTIPAIQLVEGYQGLQDGESGLYKYQPLQELLSSILTVIQGQRRDKIAGSNGSASVIGVYSASGGSGKTTVALHLCRHLSAEGLKVLYLNLETVSSDLPDSPSRFGSDGPGMARLLYDLQASIEKKEPLSEPVSNYINRDQLLNADRFEPLANLNELLQLSKEDTICLLNYLADAGDYDLIIVDLDSYPCGRTLGVLERSDELVWLVTDEREAVQKAERWFSHFERTDAGLISRILNKSLFTVNRCLGNRVHTMPLEQVVSYRTLPYIPAWKQRSTWEDVLGSPDYQREVMKLCRQILEGSSSYKAAAGGGGA